MAGKGANSTFRTIWGLKLLIHHVFAEKIDKYLKPLTSARIHRKVSRKVDRNVLDDRR